MTSIKHMPSTFVNTFISHLKCFQFIGLDFFEETKILSLNSLKFTGTSIIVLMLVTSQFVFFFKTEEMGADFLSVANAIPCAMIFGQDIIKINLLRKKHQIRQIIEEIADLWPCDVENEEKMSIMNSWTRPLKMFIDTVRKFTFVAVVLFVGFPFLKTFATLFSGQVSYFSPFDLYHPFKIDSLWIYSIVYIYEGAAASIGHMCIYQSCDLLLLTMTVDICILLRLLQYDLQNIKVVGRDGGRRDPTQDEKCYQEVKRIARTHQKLVRLSETLSEMFGIINFAVVSSSSIVLCFFGFLIIVSKIDFQMLKYLMAFGQIIFNIFCITLPGQILSDTSIGIANAAYESLWYESDLRFRKIIFIMITRSQKPCRLSALGYCDLNFITLSKVCSTAWSYLSLINQMYQSAVH